MQLSTILGALALTSSVLAGPIATPPHQALSATVSDFKAARNATHINYACTIKVHPDHAPATFTHATKGTSVPDQSLFWDSSDDQLYLRFQRVPSANAPDSYRLVLSDVHVTGNTVNLAYFSPCSDWEGKWRTVYTGPEVFNMEL